MDGDLLLQLYVRLSNLDYEGRVLYGCVRGGDELIAPNETNIVTSKNWSERINNTVKAARGCGDDVALPTAHGSFTYNLDKGGNDIICSVCLGNRENGN